LNFQYDKLLSTFAFDVKLRRSGVGIINMSKSGTINSINMACEHLFGISSSEAPGKAFKVRRCSYPKP
jgi:hypothetical protein